MYLQTDAQLQSTLESNYHKKYSNNLVPLKYICIKNLELRIVSEALQKVPTLFPGNAHVAGTNDKRSTNFATA